MRDDDPRIPADALTGFAKEFLSAMNCPEAVALEVAAHLVEADARGIYSHGCMRLPQYLDWAREDLFDPAGNPKLRLRETGAPIVDGCRGFGIPATRIAAEEGARRAREAGVSVIAVTNVGHTGRIGAFAEMAADQGCLAIFLGGGTRK